MRIRGAIQDGTATTKSITFTMNCSRQQEPVVTDVFTQAAMMSQPTARQWAAVAPRQPVGFLNSRRASLSRRSTKMMAGLPTRLIAAVWSSHVPPSIPTFGGFPSSTRLTLVFPPSS
jgi:hypothetical protein